MRPRDMESNEPKGSRRTLDAVGRFLIGVGEIWLAFSLVAVVATIGIEVFRGLPVSLTVRLAISVVGMGIVLCWPIGWLGRHLCGLAAPVVQPTERMEDLPDKFALYLREFRRDGKPIWKPKKKGGFFLQHMESYDRQVGSGVVTQEQSLAIAFRERDCPLVCVIPPGKLRSSISEIEWFHAPDETWLDRVAALIKRATLIIIRPSHSDGIKQETEMVLRDIGNGIPCERVVCWVPGGFHEFSLLARQMDHLDPELDLRRALDRAGYEGPALSRDEAPVLKARAILDQLLDTKPVIRFVRSGAGAPRPEFVKGTPAALLPAEPTTGEKTDSARPVLADLRA